MDQKQIESMLENNRAQMIEISNLFGQMPFGGICHFRRYNSMPQRAEDVFGLEAIAHNLTELVAVLEQHVLEHRALEQELDRYKYAVRGYALLQKLAAEQSGTVE